MHAFRIPLICAGIFMISTFAYAQPVVKSTLDNQVSVEVTVYNQQLGLVKDIREIKLDAGQGELRFMDVAAYINPVSVCVKSLTAPADFTILEQNYEYDLMNRDKLLDKYVGKDIKLIQWNQYQDRTDIIDATLLSNNSGQIYKIQNEIYLGHPGTQILPEIPGNLIDKPTLMWLYENRSKNPQKLEVSYLTNNINWKADYILSLSVDDAQTDLSGWVTVDNKSGATYRDAKLQLVAGDVNRVREDYRNQPRAMLAMAVMEKAAPAFESQPFFEYHIYNLKRKTTLKDNQTKQINFLEVASIPIQKIYQVSGNQYFFTQPYRSDDYKVPVEVFTKFLNSKKNNLGMPLPAGVMRFYKKDKAENGSLQFVGEDRIEHTPEEEEVKLKLGNAFDVTAERIQTDFKQVTSNLFETEWKIKIRNHKDQNISVKLVEILNGNWKVLKSSIPFVKKDAYKIEFDVPVSKKGDVEVTYRLSVGI